MAFRSEADAIAWEQGRGGDPGAIVPVEVLGELSRDWYGGRLEDEWRPWSARARQALLREAGLDGPFWELDWSDGRRTASPLREDCGAGRPGASC